MQTRQLHVLLHAFAADAAMTLAAAVAAGEEVPFEIVEEGANGSRTGLYCYQPLTSEFVDRHWDCLLRLPSAQAALAAIGELGGGLRDYLDTYADEQRAAVPVAVDVLRCFTHRALDAAAGEFELTPERFEPAYRELHQSTLSDRSELAVVALVRGLGCESAEVMLAEGTMLVPLERLEVLPPDAAWRDQPGPATVVALTPGEGPGALEDVLTRLRDLQTALRLYAPGVALAPLAWIRGERAAWRALPIPGFGRGDGTVKVAAAQEDELRAFASLVARRRPVDGELAWALDRFEMGCERDDPRHGLSDHLLALRALLEPEGPRTGRLAGRVASLCAPPEQRVAVTERVAHAISLEQSLVAGITVGGDALALCAEVEHHLRALLRDVICGHLQPQLVELADSLLRERAEPEHGEVRVRRVRRTAPAAPEVFAGFDDAYCAAEGEPSLLADTL